jgi:uncharacterized membrane protein
VNPGHHGNAGEYVTAQRAFLVLSILFGIAFVFITPPFQTPDEPHQFFRSYQVSEGELLAVVHRQPNGDVAEIGGYLPSSLSETTRKAMGTVPSHCDIKVDLHENVFSLLGVPLDQHRRTFVPFTDTARYPFVPYLPQAVGVLIGRVLGLSPLLLLYMGRLTNLAAWIFLTYWSIRVVPTGKWVFFLAALTPMSLFIGASISGDAATNGLSFFFIALMIRCGIASRCCSPSAGRPTSW